MYCGLLIHLHKTKLSNENKHPSSESLTQLKNPTKRNKIKRPSHEFQPPIRKSDTEAKTDDEITFSKGSKSFFGFPNSKLFGKRRAEKSSLSIVINSLKNSVDDSSVKKQSTTPVEIKIIDDGTPPPPPPSKKMNLSIKKASKIIHKHNIYEVSKEDVSFNLCSSLTQPISERTPSFQIVQAKNTSLWSIPYEKQLKIKEDEVLGISIALKKVLLEINPLCSAWFQLQETRFPAFCKLMPMAPAPEIEGYLSKCEFIIGVNKDTSLLTVGLQVIPKTNKVGAIDHLKNITPSIKNTVKTFQKFIRTYGLSPYDPMTGLNNWMSCSVRSTSYNEIMLVISLSDNGLDEIDIEELAKAINVFYTKGDGAVSKIKSIYLDIFHSDKPKTIRRVFGDPFVFECMMGLKFALGPKTPFSINPRAKEVLYKIGCDVSGLCLNTTLIDLNCGAGALGLSLASKVGQVIGLDYNSAFVNEAKLSANHNEIKNALFFHGKVEDILQTLHNHIRFPNKIVVISEATVQGINLEVVKSLRRLSGVQKVLFILNDHRSMFGALCNFCSLPPSKSSGDPLLPVEIIPLDTAPHTYQFAMLLVLMKITLTELTNPHSVNLNKLYSHALNGKETIPGVVDLSEGLTSEQLSWLNHMTASYGSEFDSEAWKKTLAQQNLQSKGIIQTIPPLQPADMNGPTPPKFCHRFNGGMPMNVQPPLPPNPPPKKS